MHVIDIYVECHGAYCKEITFHSFSVVYTGVDFCFTDKGFAFRQMAIVQTFQIVQCYKSQATQHFFFFITSD